MVKSIVAAACLAAASASLAFLPMRASGQAFPSRPVRIIIPQKPGGSSDVMTRAVAARLSERWGQPVVVDFKAGAGGNIGAEFVARSPADGYTLLLGYLGTQAINGALYKNLPYDPEKDFVAASALATISMMVVVNNQVPASSMAELIALAKQKQLHYASSGNGSINHLMGVLINKNTGVQIEHVPYKGIAQALIDTIGGRVEVLYIGTPAVIGQVKSGQVKPIAVTSEKRVDAVKSVPTMAESGYKDLGFEPWFGLFAPAGTPAAVLRKIHDDVNDVLRTRDVVDKFAAAGVAPLILSQEAFQAIVKADTQKWGAIVRASGAKVD